MQREDAAITARIRVVQMLAAALLLGVVIFAALATVTNIRSTQSVQAVNVLRITGFALMALVCPMAMLARSVMLRPTTASGATNPYASTVGDSDIPLENLERSAGRFAAATIISFALLEGVALFAIVVRLLTGNPSDLLIALAPVVLMLASFPTMGRWRRFAGLRVRG